MVQWSNIYHILLQMGDAMQYVIQPVMQLDKMHFLLIAFAFIAAGTELMYFSYVLLFSYCNSQLSFKFNHDRRGSVSSAGRYVSPLPTRHQMMLQWLHVGLLGRVVGCGRPLQSRKHPMKGIFFREVVPVVSPRQCL